MSLQQMEVSARGTSVKGSLCLGVLCEGGLCKGQGFSMKEASVKGDETPALTSSGRDRTGQYASYWNAFFCNLIAYLMKFDKTK